MECGRLIPHAQVPSGGHTMGPLWVCSGCGIRWENNSCLFEQLHNRLHGVQIKGPTKRFLPLPRCV